MNTILRCDKYGLRQIHENLLARAICHRLTKISIFTILTVFTAQSYDYQRIGWTPKETVLYDNSLGIGSGISYSFIQVGNAVAYGSIYAVPKIFFATPSKFDFTTGVEASAFIAAFAFEVSQRWEANRYDFIFAPKIGTSPIGLISFYYSFPYAVTASRFDSRKNTFELNFNIDLKSWNAMK